MALDVSKENDTKVDTSFIQRKRSPKTKERSQVMSPFSENLSPVEIKEYKVENAGTAKTNDKTSEEAKNTKSAKKKSLSKPCIEYSDLSLKGAEIGNIVEKIGVNKAIYAILLLSKSEDKKIRISQTECADLFGIQSSKNAKLILNSLEEAKLIEKAENPNLKLGVSTLYKLNF